MNPWGDLLGGHAAELGFGGVTGAVVGYTAKKVTKLVAFLLGIVFIVIQLLVYQGLVSVDWKAVQTTAEGVWSTSDGVTLADRAWDILRHQLPFGGAFVAGFVLGFKLG